MGLDIGLMKNGKMIDSFRAGSYSGFGDFRRKLATIVTINLNDMDGYGGETTLDTETPFYELFNHSDCEDDLPHTDCVNLIKDFNDEKILEKVEKEDVYFISKFNEWKKFIKLCSEDKETRLNFG